MSKPSPKPIAGFSAGMLFTRSLRRVMKLSGYAVYAGWAGVRGDDIAVWGRIPRSLKVLAKYRANKSVTTFEDAFLRSVLPGLKSPPAGLCIDKSGVYFDCETCSDLERLLTEHPLDDQELLVRATCGRAFLRHYGLSKYNPAPRRTSGERRSGYILVIDQVRDDASVTFGRANAATFSEMLAAAKSENPGCDILIRTHPATKSSEKTGYFGPLDVVENVSISSEPMNPWDVLEGAEKVYCVTSQMGFEAILAGHRPHVFGVPFYAGWGLSDDRQAVPRRARQLSVDQLFAAAMLIYPFWCPISGEGAGCFETTAQNILAQSQHHWETQTPVVAHKMRLWKRANVARFLGDVSFQNDMQKAIDTCQKFGAPLVVWAGQETPDLEAHCAKANVSLYRMEDGFVRSKGLGAELVPASSLVIDDLGIYYNKDHPSRLESYILASASLPDFSIKRARALRHKIVQANVSKYNLTANRRYQPTSEKPVILVVGQVEDDASILKGTFSIRTNLALLKTARAENPDGYIVYKPHPDVVAGLRIGAVEDADLREACDVVSTKIELSQCASLWTMTSLMGFEALLRGIPVTCVGTPFYAGWGLTNDLGQPSPRRTVKVTVDQLIHAALIDYPRYFDTVSGRPCSVEALVNRLENDQISRPFYLSLLSKLQGILASAAPIWR